MCKLSAGLDASGALVGLQVRLSGQSINAYVSPQTVVDGKDKRQLQCWWEEPGDAQLGYSVPNLRVEYAMRNSHVPVGPWRGVNTNQNGAYIECFIDEVARAAKADSLEFRRRLMGKHPKHRAVLNAAAERAGWSTPLPPGVHRGIAPVHGLRQLLGCGRRGLGQPGRRARGSSHGAGARLRACGQSGPDRGAGRGLGRLRIVGGAVRRDQHRARARGRAEFPQLPGAAAGRDAEGRDCDRADLRLLGWRRRADDMRRNALRAQCDPCRHRQAGAQPAAAALEAG